MPDTKILDPKPPVVPQPAEVEAAVMSSRVANPNKWVVNLACPPPYNLPDAKWPGNTLVICDCADEAKADCHYSDLAPEDKKSFDERMSGHRTNAGKVKAEHQKMHTEWVKTHPGVKCDKDTVYYFTMRHVPYSFALIEVEDSLDAECAKACILTLLPDCPAESLTQVRPPVLPATAMPSVPELPLT